MCMPRGHVSLIAGIGLHSCKGHANKECWLSVAVRHSDHPQYWMCVCTCMVAPQRGPPKVSPPLSPVVWWCGGGGGCFEMMNYKRYIIKAWQNSNRICNYRGIKKLWKPRPPLCCLLK